MKLGLLALLVNSGIGGSGVVTSGSQLNIADVGATAFTIAAPVSGLYQVSFYGFSVINAGAGTATFKVSFNDGSSRTISVATLGLDGGGNQGAAGAFQFQAVAGQTITAFTTVSGVAAPGTYNLFASLIRIS
jgi:hypothetical protein